MIQTTRSWGRGYGRLFAFPEYVLLGAGEGEFNRFGIGHQLELHSAPATLIFSYGLPGVLLLGGWVFAIVRANSVQRLMLLAPAAIYLLTHQGLRFTMLWVVVALLAALPCPGDCRKGCKANIIGSAETTRAHQCDARLAGCTEVGHQ